MRWSIHVKIDSMLCASFGLETQSLLISRMNKHCVLLLPFFGYPMVMLRLHT